LTQQLERSTEGVEEDRLQTALLLNERISRIGPNVLYRYRWLLTDRGNPGGVQAAETIGPPNPARSIRLLQNQPH
jgi:hypothetical protein